MDPHVLAAHLGWPYNRVGPAGAAEALGRVRGWSFPTKDVVVACQILLAAHSGNGSDDIGAINLADIDGAGDRNVLVCSLKGRTGPEGLHLPKRATAVLRLEYAYAMNTAVNPAECRVPSGNQPPSAAMR